MAMIKKKFRVRTRHFASGRFVVEYANYRFIPVWYSLQFWFDQGHPGGTECWSTNMWNAKEAEAIARSLKTIEDVSKYYEPEEKKRKLWKMKEVEWWRNHAPYNIKEIKHD